MGKKQNAEETYMTSQYRLSGRHAQRSYQLTRWIDAKKTLKLFKRNVDVIMNAPLVGFLYHRLADVDKTKDPETNKVYDFSVMDSQMIDAHHELMFNFRLIMLLDKEYEPDDEKRIDKGLRHFAEEEEDCNRFESYLRGGIDVLYEKLVDGAKEEEDYLEKLHDFTEDFRARFNEGIDRNEVLAKLRK